MYRVYIVLAYKLKTKVWFYVWKIYCFSNNYKWKLKCDICQLLAILYFKYSLHHLASYDQNKNKQKYEQFLQQNFTGMVE